MNNFLIENTNKSSNNNIKSLSTTTDQVNVHKDVTNEVSFDEVIGLNSIGSE